MAIRSPGCPALVAPTSGTLSGTAPNLIYTPKPGFAGADVFAFEVADGGGGTDVASTAVNVTSKVRRVPGDDGYQIALASSRETFGTGRCPTVVLASGARWDDALAASGLAGTVRSPVLLTKPTSLPSGLVSELKRLGAKRIYLVGNSTSVSNGVVTSLKNSGFSVTRISGANRYEVAKNVSYRIEALRGNNKVTQAFVVRGDAFYDALMVSALAYNRKVPVLYTPKKSLSTNTARAIRALDIDEVIIGGDTNVVSSRVARSMARLRSVDRVTRWGGYGAAGTSVAITNGAAKRGWISYSTVGTVNWVSYPDGLSASSAIGYRRGPLLLLARTSLLTQTRDLLRSHKSQIRSVWVFGRPATVNEPVLGAMRVVVD